MLFGNLQLYRFAKPFTLDPQDLALKLDQHIFAGCGSLDPQSRGWTSPTGKPGSQVHSLNRQILIALRIEEKVLPAVVIRQHAEERAREIGEQQGHRPGRKQMHEIRENVMNELLQRAFAKQRTTFAWIDPVNGWLVVDAGSPKKAEEVLEMLHKATDAFALKLPKTLLSPTSAMTGWLLADEAPAGFTIDRDCELRAPGEEKATVRYLRHPLEAEQVRRHIEDGKQTTRLSLTWNDRISFSLNEDFQIKRLAFLDILKEEVGQEADNAEELFDADFAMMTGELARFIPALVEALGGEDKD